MTVDGQSQRDDTADEINKISAKGSTRVALVWVWGVSSAASPFPCSLHPCAFPFIRWDLDSQASSLCSEKDELRGDDVVLLNIFFSAY